MFYSKKIMRIVVVQQHDMVVFEAISVHRVTCFAAGYLSLRAYICFCTECAVFFDVHNGISFAIGRLA